MDVLLYSYIFSSIISNVTHLFSWRYWTSLEMTVVACLETRHLLLAQE